MAINEILIKIHYSLRDTKWPLIVSVVGVVINTALSIAFSRLIGVKGIALATSVSMFVMLIMLVGGLKSKIKERILNKAFIFNFAKLIGASILAFASGYLIRLLISDLNQMLLLLIVSLIAAVLYLSTCLVTKESTISKFLCRLKRGTKI